MTTSDGAAAEPMPLAPPDPVVTLTAPEPPAVVLETQAPKMAPPVSADALPELDAKVDSFMTALGMGLFQRVQAHRLRQPEWALFGSP